MDYGGMPQMQDFMQGVQGGMGGGFGWPEQNMGGYGGGLEQLMGMGGGMGGMSGGFDTSGMWGGGGGFDPRSMPGYQMNPHYTGPQ